MSQEDYIKFCTRHLPYDIIRRQVDQTKTAINKLSIEIDRAAAHLITLNTKLQNFHADCDNEFDLLINSPYIKNITFHAETLHIFTDTIYLEYNEHYYEIGDFELIFQLNNYSLFNPFAKNLRVKELTGQYNFHHPHIAQSFQPDEDTVYRESGTARMCLGNAQYVSDYLHKGNFLLGVHAFIQFLHSLTKHQHYISFLIKNWKITFTKIYLQKVNKKIKNLKPERYDANFKRSL